MRAYILSVVAIVPLLLSVPCTSRAQTATPGADTHYQPFPTIWSGVYTTDEADRGKQTAANLCGRCHGPELKGTDTAPGLTGARFFDRWNNLMLLDVIAWIQSAMPGDHGFFVTAKQSREIVGYMLRESGAPSGRAPISDDINVLNQILVIRKPSR